jgi:hypothetical protein
MKVLSTLILDIPNNERRSLSELNDELRRLRGVERVSVNPVVEKVTVDYNPFKSTVDEIRAVVDASRRESKGDKQTQQYHPKRRR